MLKFNGKNQDFIERISLKYYCSIITFNRKENFSNLPDYLDMTITSLKKSGFFESTIDATLFLNDSGPKEKSHIIKYENNPKIQCFYLEQFPKFEVHVGYSEIVKKANYNAFLALERSLDYDYEWFIFMEDDLEFCNRFIESVDLYIQDWITSSDRLISFYTPYEQVEACYKQKVHAWKYRVGDFYGAQCFAIRKVDVGYLLNHLKKLFIPNSPWGLAVDINLKHWLWDNYPAYNFFVASVPSFVQHKGNMSSLSSHQHVAQSYKGEQWTYDRKYYNS